MKISFYRENKKRTSFLLNDDLLELLAFSLQKKQTDCVKMVRELAIELDRDPTSEGLTTRIVREVYSLIEKEIIRLREPVLAPLDSDTQANNAKAVGNEPLFYVVNEEKNGKFWQIYNLGYTQKLLDARQFTQAELDAEGITSNPKYYTVKVPQSQIR